MSIESTDIKPDFNQLENEPKEPFKVKAERFIDKYTPNFVKRFCNKVLDILPEKTSHWIREHRFFTICIIYIIRGLFLRPSMWLVYMAIWAYFKN